MEHLAGTHLRFTLSGPPAAALRALADADITAVTMRDSTLEEILLDHYGDIAS